MEDLLSQDDLNALLGGLSESKTTAPREEATIIGIPGGTEDLLSQDDLNALLGGLSGVETAAPRKELTIVDAPAAASKGESMSQDEIDELLRQFDKDI